MGVENAIERFTLDEAQPLEGVERVRIVGGGLSGILAAFQAHRFGIRQIDLYERLDRLGGVAQPPLIDGCEMRQGCIYFGPKGDPIRDLLEAHGARFEEFENRFGSVSNGLQGPQYLTDFGGPAIARGTSALSPRCGNSLADRLACYDPQIASELADYVRWHTGADPRDLDESAAIPLAINRIYPAAADCEALAAQKKRDPLADELFGIPRSQWGYASNLTASLPEGGFPALFAHCREALRAIGVMIHDTAHVKPRDILAGGPKGEAVVWAASPMALFKPLGLTAPRAPARKFATYTFEAQFDGPVPFYVQNFTATGAVFRIYIYQSKNRQFLSAECVAKADETMLPAQIQQMAQGFDGHLQLGKIVHRSIEPRWLYHSPQTMASLAALRGALRNIAGAQVIPGAWEAYAKAAKFAEIERALGRAILGQEAAPAP